MSLWNRLRLGIFYCIITRAVLVVSLNKSEEISSTYQKLTPETHLWSDLVNNCKNPSVACVKKTIYNYFDHLLEYPEDLTLFTGIRLIKNSVNFDDIRNSTLNTADNEAIQRSSHVEEITEALHDKVVKFMMTHDLVVTLPEPIFDGASLTVSPRTFDGDGALIKLDTVPAQGRIFFKKIKKFISNKLLVAFLAILLVIKLIAVKFLFFLPMIMGVAAAKKLLLKVLLFLFPVLSHLFKLCPYYAPTKLHHHQHHIAHVHHLSHLPSLHHSVELDHPPPGWNGLEHDQGFDYYSDGPGVTDYRRKNFIDTKFKPPEEPDAWIGGQGQASVKRPIRVPGGKPFTPAEIENMIRQAEKEATLKARLQEEQKRVESDNKRLQEQIKQLIKVQEKLKLQQTILKENSKLTAGNILQTANLLPQPQFVHAVAAPSMQQAAFVHPPAMVGPLPVYQGTYQNQAHANHVHKNHFQSTTQAPQYDTFYTPILEKIDKVLVEIGYNDEACRERLICSMYKNPTKFSPHSNLISAELSRDASELQKPTSSNASVIRFYKYVQAARDGQDKRDCIRLYPACVINTDT